MSELENTQQDTVTCDEKKSDLEPSIIDRPAGTVDRQVEDVAGLRADNASGLRAEDATGLQTDSATGFQADSGADLQAGGGAGLRSEDATGLQADSAANPQTGNTDDPQHGGSIELEQDVQAYGVLDIERSDEMSGVAGPKGGDRTNSAPTTEEGDGTGTDPELEPTRDIPPSDLVEAGPGQNNQSPEAIEPKPDDQTGASGIAGAARTVSALFSEGVTSMKEVNAAHRAHAAARDELERLDNTIASREAELEHRRGIAARYDEIIAEESARKNAARKNQASATQQREKILAKLAELKKQLEDMREEDATTERHLKTALEAAEDKERSARESGRRLQRRLDDAQANLDRTIKEQSEGVAAAHQAVTSAEAHLTTLNSEYAEIQKNPSANPAGYSVRKRELEDEISDATEALRNAKSDVPRIEQETQTAIDEARAAVTEAERPIATAKEAFNTVAAAADRARDAYGEAREDAEKRQKELRGAISEGEKAAKAQERAAQDAQARVDAAQAAIDEANDIHAHPEATAALVNALEADRAEREERVVEVEQLAGAEQAVRERTRGARVRLTLAVTGIALTVLLMFVWTYIAQ